MRKFLMPLLMASVLMPAAAYAAPGERGRSERAERAERSEDSDSAPKDRPQRAQRVERSNSDAPRVRVERAERPARVERAARAERSVDVQTSEPVRVQRVQRIERQRVAQPVQQVRRIERRRDGSNDGFVGAIRQAGDDENARQRGEVVVRDRDGDRRWDGNRDGDRRWDGNRDGDRRWDRNRDGDRRWSRDWRRDSRYNWYGYRHRYGSLFRLGRYYDPYGYNYRRFSIGFSLWPSYYGSNYWLNDPWHYRLPPAYGPYRWVRYYDDALLVNIYTGQVVDVIHNVFW